ncbi:MBL fold metallo-hydrolase RNA specificity domain-containing protein [Anaeromyxobacter sp. Fw109-5]|uniref:MBL fold metallo-hydrolase RNA specificity domain-containing protein n=1 Tax=Anaeromyxobacter sp. (strain Fw109-5) TaxID=404589 RepID=UPI0000ED8B04|nr:MBL fold metallo-hydrolase [Anaeromyxobacter sp. Fw109-5]ABS26244.1 beta-lactamase domain protein [Anaeromyxobacter sp. Fw109-5]
MASIRFLGAAGTVTGSRFLVESGSVRVLVDAGLFQGQKELRLRNRAPWPVPPSSIDAVVLTHAHVDHTGALPLLVRDGFRGLAHCTPATRDLAGLLLPDSGRLQEEEARFANRRGYSKHAPHAAPLYSEADALAALPRLSPLPYDEERAIAPGVRVRFRRAGHILGSALVELALDGPRPLRLLFSGDLGRYGAPILPDPDPGSPADALVLESTYAGKAHPDASPAAALAEEIRRAVRAGGAVIIPAFAIGRTQEVLFTLRALEARGEIPALPVFVDSPMAVDATALFLAHRADHDDETTRLIEAGEEPLRPAKLSFCRSTDQSKALNDVRGPCVILSASGMATGGRVLHHLARRLPDPRTTVLLVGFQAAGTRGWTLQSGAPTVRIHGEDVPVKARVATISGFSAHADEAEISRWLATFPSPPARTLLVHGEPAALAAAKARMDGLGWRAHVPAHLEELAL